MTLQLQDAYIIVIEDDRNAQIIMLDLLRMNGVQECYARENVEFAMKLAERLERVDVFLVDLHLPEKSGFDFLQEARQTDKLKGAKFILITADSSERSWEQAIEMGFDGFIIKPLRGSTFAQQIQDVLKGKQVWQKR